MAAYGTDAGFNGWLDANGYEFAGDLPESVLRERASAYIDALYGPRFVGVPVSVTQDLAWPRSGATAWGMAIAGDATPAAVVNSVYAAAYAEMKSPGTLSATYTPGQAKVLTKVGDISWTPVQGATGATSWMPVLTVVEGLLAPFLVGGIHGRGVAMMVV